MDVMLAPQMATEAANTDRIAVGSLEGGPTYCEMLGQASTAGAFIARQGFRHLAYCGVNTPAFPVALFSAALAGRPFVALNYRLADTESSKGGRTHGTIARNR